MWESWYRRDNLTQVLGLCSRRRTASRGSELPRTGGRIKAETRQGGARDPMKVEGQTRCLESRLGFPKTVVFQAVSKTVILGPDLESSPDSASDHLHLSLVSLSGTSLSSEHFSRPPSSPTPAPEPLTWLGSEDFLNGGWWWDPLTPAMSLKSCLESKLA